MTEEYSIKAPRVKHDQAKIARQHKREKELSLIEEENPAPLPSELTSSNQKSSWNQPRPATNSYTSLLLDDDESSEEEIKDQF